MAASTDEEGKTSPRDSPFADDDPSTKLHQQDIQRKLDEALNSIRVKDDEITRLTNLRNSKKSEPESYRVKFLEAQKEISEWKVALNCAKITINAQEKALLLANKSCDENSKSSQNAQMDQHFKSRSDWERLLKAKNKEIEKLKKENEIKDETIKALQKTPRTPKKSTQEKEKNGWQVPVPHPPVVESSPVPPPPVVESSPVPPPPVVESSPVLVSPNSVEEVIELSSEFEDDQSKNAVDFVDELLQDNYPSAHSSEDDDDDSDDNHSDPDDQDYQPNPNWYRNKIVKKLKGKRKVKKVKGKRKRTTTTTPGGGSLSCPVCPLREDGTKQIYSGITGLNYHMSINHPGHPGFNTERFQCSDCPEIFVRKADLTKHLRSAHLEVRYKCKFCSKSFSSPHYCHHHEKLHENTGGGPAVLPCSKCSKVFTSKLGLRQHMVTIHPHGAGTHKCKHCDALFKHLKALRLHITSNHRIKPLSCPHCSKTYTKKGGLRRHIQSHSTDVKPEVSGVGRVGGGLRHSIEAKRQLRHHLESKGLSQDVVNQSLNTSVGSVMAEFLPGLGVIPEITLDGAEETTCQYCGIEFGQNQSRQLKIHLSRHRFKCIKCLDMFDQSSSLRYHLSVTHKIEGEAAEELVMKGVQSVESHTPAMKNEPDLDLDEMIY